MPQEYQERPNLISTGTIISERYKIVRLIGEGGMGCVYEATHTTIGKRIALKVLNKEFSRNNEALERFQQEAKIAGTIGHLNICEVMDFGITDDGQPFLVMEYLDGESLAAVLERDIKVPLDTSFDILLQILDALEEVHSKGILHRDLKPENVFLTSVKGHGNVVKLLDFGISKVMKQGSESMRLTKTGTMVGTPYYMSPEHIRAKKDLDQRADLYSCGVMLYEMVTGEVPHKGEGYSQIIASILEDPIPDPRNLTPGLPGQVVEFINRAMEKNPSKRPQTTAQYKQEIMELQQNFFGKAPQRGKFAHFGRTKMGSIVISPAVTRRKTTMWKIMAITGTLAGVIMLGVLILSLLYSESKIETLEPGKAGTEQEQEQGAVEEKPGEVPAEEPSTTPPPKPETEMVKITLEHAPENVRIIFGDVEIDGHEFELEKSSMPVQIKITAVGYEDRKAEIVPLGDMEIDADLKLATPGKPGKKKDGKKKSGKKSTKKEKLGHVWSYPK